MEQQLKERANESIDALHPMRQGKIAYIVSRFPKLTETFILYEIIAVEGQGVQVELFPLQQERAPITHPEAVALVDRAHFTPLLSLPILQAHLHFLRKKPGAYLKTLWTLLRANWGSTRYLAGAIAFFPKAVYLACKMATEEIHHIHAHFASHPAVVAYVIHQLTGIPYSFTAHGSDLHRDRHMLREKVQKALFTVTISNYNKDVILTECGKEFSEQVKVIHCGVDTDVFCRNGYHDRLAESKPPIVLCVGTLHEVKGQGHLLKACQLLHNRGLDVECHFVGDGPDRLALAQQAKQLGINDLVHFHGAQTRERVVALLQNADIIAAPSVPSSDGRREGIPVALMEAMAVGKPVVASQISGIPELVEDGQTGLLVPPGDAVALAQALERLFHDPMLRQQMSDAARKRIVDEFNLFTNADRLVAHFRMEMAR
jgi:colanic acid/amylovoran biosynthesis glycosyltransferase